MTIYDFFSFFFFFFFEKNTQLTPKKKRFAFISTIEQRFPRVTEGDGEVSHSDPCRSDQLRFASFFLVLHMGSGSLHARVIEGLYPVL